MKIKLTKQEKNWILYDVGNSAFTLLAATILPIYFNYIAGKQGLSDVQYLAYWGYAVSIATLLTALAGPVFGTVADTKGYKKPVFTIALGIGAIASVALGFAKYWLAFLVVFVIAKVGYSVTLVFYDSMLVDVTLEDRMDEVSSQGYAWGYIGSCVPFVICLLVVLNAGKIGITMEIAMMVFLCDHHGMVGNYDITTSENLSPEVLCRKEAACFFRKLQKNRHYSEKCKEGEEGFSVSSGVFLLY